MGNPIPFDAGKVSAISSFARQWWKERRGGKYFFRRGPVDYASWPYESKGPRLISFQIDESTMFRPQNEATLALEVSAKMANKEDVDIDDGIQDEMREDIATFVYALSRAKYPGSTDVLISGMFPEELPVLEYHDSQIKVQAVTFSFRVHF